MLIIAILVLACSLSFGLGYLAGKDVGQRSGDSPLSVSSEAGQAPTSEVEAPTGSVGVVASKNGTKYYLPSCSGANRISVANKISFPSPAAATAAGYTPAANCKGI